MHLAKPYSRAILIFLFIIYSCRIGLMEVLWCIFQGMQGSHAENAVWLRKDQAEHTLKSFA